MVEVREGESVRLAEACAIRIERIICVIYLLR